MNTIRLFPSILFFFLFPFPLLGDAAEPDAAKPNAEVRALVKKLGDDSYVVRQRSEARLLRIGIEAFSELKRALKDSDVEIARRAEQILGQFELIYLGQEDSTVRELVDLYTMEPNIVQKATYIWAFANPIPQLGYSEGEGFRTLCRIVRFEPERALRVEAVKCLIALAPLTPSKQKKWYRSLAQLFSDPGEDELFRLILDFATLRCDVDALKEEAEKKAKEDEKTTGRPVEYPVAIKASGEIVDRLRHFADRLSAFQSNPDNNTIQVGSWVDILLRYALIELQDDLGLVQQRDRLLDAAVAIRTEAFQSDNPLLPIDPLIGQSLADHYYVGLILMERDRFHWSERHFRAVLAEGAIELKSRACSLIASIRHLLGDMPEAVRVLDENLKILGSEDYSAKYNNAEEKKKETEARKFYYIAQMAADAGDWKKAVGDVDRVLENDRHEIDTIILRYEICRHLPELGQDYRDKMKPLIDDAIKAVEKQMNEGMRQQVVCNQVAWLLANTGGDYATARALIDITVKLEPESAVYLDTQAHVFALGKEYDKAVESQEKAVRLAPEAVVFRKALERFRKAASSPPNAHSTPI